MQNFNSHPREGGDSTTRYNIRVWEYISIPTPVQVVTCAWYEPPASEYISIPTPVKGVTGDGGADATPVTLISIPTPVKGVTFVPL